MSETEQNEIEQSEGEIVAALRRYARDNPLAMLAGAAIVGMLLARFAYLGNSRGRS